MMQRNGFYGGGGSGNGSSGGFGGFPANRGRGGGFGGGGKVGDGASFGYGNRGGGGSNNYGGYDSGTRGGGGFDYGGTRGGRGGPSRGGPGTGRGGGNGGGGGGGRYGGGNYGGGGYGGRAGSDYAFGGEAVTSNLAPSGLEKNFYNEHTSIQGRTSEDVKQWLEEKECTLNGTDIPKPITTFHESTFPEQIQNLLLANYESPTTIQSISWPVALSGRDIISIAKTGSGKTLGFILPGIVHIMNQPPRNTAEGPVALVLLPTRELALQVEEVAQLYCNAMNLKVTCCYGGADKGPQSRQLKLGIDVCIATPGRLLDFLEGGVTNMRRCTYLVLDEADRMLDMGFEPQIRKIVAQIRPCRQTLMFSATWPREVRNLASDFQKNAVHLNVGSLDMAANHNIVQNVEIIEDHLKPQRLSDLLNEISDSKTLVFVATKRKADELCREMRLSGWPALCIHGDKEQSEREWVLKQFREGQITILLATDVVARGIDVQDIKFVINYDYPNDHREYIHRIGRTGRCNQKGVSYTFMTTRELHKANDLIKVLKEANQQVPDDLQRRSGSSKPMGYGYGSGGGGFGGSGGGRNGRGFSRY